MDERFDIAEIKKLCGLLDDEPLFHASLGSKELFHSNMIEWFTNHCRDAAAQAFGPWTSSAPGTPWQATQREWRHLDLVVNLADQAPLVIENKVFSPPRDEQLKGYTADLAEALSPTPAFALLSLVTPGWAGGHATFDRASWHHYSYGQLADGLDAALDLVPGGYARDTVAHYCVVIRTLQHIADFVNDAVGRFSDIRLSREVAAILRKVRLDQGFEKLRTRTIAYRLADYLALDDLDGSQVRDGYMRSWPLLEWFTDVPGTSDQLGWQLQEGQWRLAVRLKEGHDHYGRGADARARREAYVAERYATWFDFTDADEILGTSGPVDPSPGSFRAFAPDFVYLYRPAKTMAVIQLRWLATGACKRAARWTT